MMFSEDFLHLIQPVIISRNVLYKLQNMTAQILNFFLPESVAFLAHFESFLQKSIF
jgi:hypothetical protein